MIRDEKIEQLTSLLEKAGVASRDHEQLAADLLDWYNVTEESVTKADMKKLVKLAARGQFESWACPSCSERCYRGNPDDWGHFQGVCQVDYSSYPGNRPDDLRCDSCRCWDY